MARYSNCPNCGNSAKGTKLHQCTKCSFIGCYTPPSFVLGSSSGCWVGYTSECPRCHHKHKILSLETNFKTLGEIR